MINAAVRGLAGLDTAVDALGKMAPEEQINHLMLAAEALANSWKDWTSGPRGPTRIGVLHDWLRGTIRAYPSRGGMRQTVSTRAEYALAHEFGVPDRNLPMRPHMRPAFDEALPIMDQIFRGEVDEAVKKADLASRAHAQAAFRVLLGQEVLHGST